MKIQNKISKALWLPLLAIAFASCNSDIDPVYVQSGNGIELSGASSDVILSSETPQALAMTIYWTADGKLTLSDPKLQAETNAATQTIQLSNDEQFSTTVDVAVDNDARSYQFLTESLNALLGRLGYTAGEKAPLYIRIRSVLGDNVSPSYSNTIQVMVQSYKIQLLYGEVLDKNWDSTGVQLASPEEDGVYTGFMGVNGWDNWYLREANQVVWGNEGVSGKSFYASSDENNRWNFWFPGDSGCYFVTLNTNKGWWSALYIKNLTVSGGVSGEMEYNKKTNQWTMPISLETASTVTINISGEGSLYNYETTDTGTPISKTVAFSGDAADLTFGETAGSISVDLPAGETTLILDLSYPLVYKLTTGTPDKGEEVAKQLYFSGLVDWATPGEGGYLSLYDESTKSYGGAHYINSEWGYRAYTEKAWTPAYKAADGGTGLSGSLELAESDGNIPAPEEGVYIMDFNMKSLTYELTKVTTVTYAGLNNDWTEHEMTQSEDNKEIYTAEFEKTAETPWGVKVLINNNWSLFFGGGSGSLTLGKSDATSGFDGDNDLTIGKTYILTVDLGKQTYSYSQK